MQKDNRIYCDYSGDACPPDGRYDRALRAVVACCSFPCESAVIAGKMVDVHAATNGYGELEWESAVQTALDFLDGKVNV